MAATKRRLTDMYRVQKPVTFDDGEGDPIKVIVRKLNPVDHQTALRHANAARSRAATLKNRPEDDEYQAQWALILDYDRDALTRFLVEDHRLTRTPILEAELADEEEWKENGYIEGLQTDWLDEMKDRYAMDPEDIEAKRVFSEMERFANQLDEIVQAEMDDFEDSLNRKDEDDLRKQVFEKLLTSYASIAWLNEYHRCEIAYSVRTEDGREKYFKHRDEVSELPPEIYNELRSVYEEITADIQEGKGSQATGDSSPSSELPANQEEPQDSGPKDATG